MNNVIRIENRRREINVNPVEVVFTAVIKVVNKVEYIIYALCYAIFAVNSFLKSKTARGMVIFYKKYLRVWTLSSLATVLSAKFFGASGVVISLAITLPVCMICAMLNKPVKHQKNRK